MIKIQRSFSPDKKSLQRVGNQVLVFSKDNIATEDEKGNPVTEETAKAALKFPNFFSVSGLNENKKAPEKPIEPEPVEIETPESNLEEAEAPGSSKEESRPARKGKKRNKY